VGIGAFDLSSESYMNANKAVFLLDFGFDLLCLEVT